MNSNPYIGLRTYEETDAAIFRGRTKASADLFRLITDNDVVVLHAESGEGKSSLLNAGLSPILRDERYFPIKINFTEEDFDLNEPDFDKIVFGRIMESIAAVNGRSAGEDFFRESPSFDGQISLVPVKGSVAANPEFKSLRENIWWLLRNYTLDTYGAALTPVLIFDQFEEVFTRPESNSWTEDFFLWLSETLNDDIPEKVIEEIRGIIGEDADFPKLLVEKRFKALFSLRTEYMGEIDYWAIQRHHISVMKNSRFCLKPLTEEEADTVLALQPAFTEETREKIKSAISNSRGKGRAMRNLPMIPAMLLSVVSTTASANIGKGESQSVEVNPEGAGTDTFIAIVSQFYSKEIGDSGIPRGILKQIEDVLVDDKGKRVRIKADAKELRKIDFLEKYKPILEQKRLIKSSQLNGDEYVELVHDAIARVIDRKRIESAASRKTTGALLLKCVWGAMVGLLLAIFGRLILEMPSQYDNSNLGLRLPYKVLECAFAAGIGWLVIYICRNHKRKWFKFLTVFSAYIVSYYLFAFLDLPLSRRGLNPALIETISTILIFTGPIAIIGIVCLLARRRWLIFTGGILFILSCIPIFFPFGDIFWLLILTMGVFFIASYLMARERNFWWCALIMIGLTLCFYFFRKSYYYTPVVVFIAVSALIILLSLMAIVSLKWPLRSGQREIDNFIFHGQAFKRFKIVKPTFFIFCATIVVFIGIKVGNYLLPGASLILAVASLLLYLCLNAASVLKQNRILLALITAISTLAIGVSQFYAFHTVFIICVWVITLFLFLFFTAQTNTEARWKTILGAVTTWGLCIVIFPFVVLGYNILALNDTFRIWEPAVRATKNTSLLYIKDRNGLLGVRDRAGKIVIPTEYDDINFYKDSRREDHIGFMLQKDGFFSDWNVYDNLTHINSLTDDVVDNYKDYMYSYWISKNTEQLRKYYKALRVRNLESGNTRSDAESIIMADLADMLSRRGENENVQMFDIYSEKSLNQLNSLSYRDVDISLLPFTSHSFKTHFLENVVPNLKVAPFGTMQDIINNDYVDPSSDEYDIKDIPQTDIFYVSEQANPIEVKKYLLGEAYSWLADMYLELADGLIRVNEEYINPISEAKKYSLLALEKGKYNEPAQITQYLSSLLSAELNELGQITNQILLNKDNLIRMNRGADGYPDPNLKDAWKFIQYNTLYTILNQKIEKLHGVLSEYDYNSLIDIMSDINSKSEFTESSNNNYPFDFIEILPYNEKYGNIKKFYKKIPSLNFDYAFYYANSDVISPTFVKISYPVSEETEYFDPILFIDYVTKKRGYMKNMYYRNSEAIPEVMEGEYDHAWPFSEGLAAVEVDGKIGFIDAQGKMVIKPQFGVPFRPLTIAESVGGWMFNIYRTKEYKQPYFKDGVAPVYDSNNQLIWIDRQGNKIKK